MLTPSDWAWYNTLVWPAPLIAYLVGVVAVVLVFARFPRRNLVISLMLAAFWAGGVVTFAVLLNADQSGGPAPLFAAAFLTEAGLIVREGVRGRLHFGFNGRLRSVVGLFLVGYALAVYPLIGAALGRPFPRGPVFGVAPCPVTLFTFGMLLLTDAHLPKHLVLIPALWSLLGIGAALSFGSGEDLILLAAAPVTVLLVATRPSVPSSGVRVCSERMIRP